MAHGGKRSSAGRKKGSKDKLTRVEVDRLRPKLYKLLGSILNKANAGGTKLSDQTRVFGVAAPYLLKTADKADEGVLSGTELLNALRAVGREMVSNPLESVEPPES